MIKKVFTHIFSILAINTFLNLNAQDFHYSMNQLSPLNLNPALTGFNLGCIDEINIFDLDNISIANGKEHPLDKK